jgi:hypothetical protein
MSNLIGGLGRLLTLADETQIDERSRNALGAFPVAALPAARGGSGWSRSFNTIARR